MNKQFLYITNWKAYFTFNQAHQWVQKNKTALATLAKNNTIIICPSFDALAIVSPVLQEAGVTVGAQNCSEHAAGAYTGQVLIQSLKEIGCTYCFVGHSEVRAELHETTQQIAIKAVLLLQAGITPIICIGESAKDYEIARGTQVIEEQLAPVLQNIVTQNTTHKTIVIGYEPLWAIGNSSMLPADYLNKQLETIKHIVHTITPSYNTPVLYGGGVNAANIRTFKDNPLLDGVLFGHASTDFQILEKIVLL